MGSKWHENKKKLSNCKNILDEKSCQLSCLTALCPGPKTIWILLKQETVSGSGISWATCKSAPRSRQSRQHLTTQFFTGQMPFLPPSQQRQSTEGKLISVLSPIALKVTTIFLSQVGTREALLCWFYTIRQKSTVMPNHVDGQRSRHTPKVTVFTMIVILQFSCSPRCHFSGQKLQQFPC